MLGNMSKTEESLRKLEKVRERQEARVETRPILCFDPILGLV